MNQETISAFDKSIEDAKQIIEFGNSVERLRTNRDFKKVIQDGYFHKEAIRLVHLKSDPAMQNPSSQAAIIAAMDAIGNLSAYLHDAIRSGEMATKQLADAEEMRVAMLAEEV